MPKTGFSCEGRSTGYYADVESGCQVYHMCDGLGRQFSYTCPNATLFQQRMMICDHWYMVNCSKAVEDYAANLRIGHKGTPFLDDNESNTYRRTPRPDLLSHPSQSEYDIIYRTGRAQFGTSLNLVGAESDTKNSTTSTTDEPVYSLPSHWSTEYQQQGTTAKPVKQLKKNFDSTSIIKGKPISTNTIPESLFVNFKSNFEATTPVFPITVDATSEEPGDLGIHPPIPDHLNNSTVNLSVTESPIVVNFKSIFQATTPIYPKTVDVTSEEPGNLGIQPPIPYQLANGTKNLADTKPQIVVNFESKFKATTPVYPKTVDITNEDPGDLGVLPPKDTATDNNHKNVPSLSLNFEPPAVDLNFKKPNTNENHKPVLPSKFYQPPKFEPDYTELASLNNEKSEEIKKGGFKALSINEWEDLRKKFLIPDYEFPLESVSRPSYDSVLSSFQASAVPSEKE